MFGIPYIANDINTAVIPLNPHRTRNKRIVDLLPSLVERAVLIFVNHKRAAARTAAAILQRRQNRREVFLDVPRGIRYSFAVC